MFIAAGVRANSHAVVAEGELRGYRLDGFWCVDQRKDLCAIKETDDRLVSIETKSSKWMWIQ